MVALKLKDEDDKPLSPDSYKKNDLVTYDEARKSTTPQPYIAAVVTSNNETMFMLGDGRNTSNPTSRRRRSTSGDYYNGPLEPGTSYSIFQRIFINEEVTACISMIKFKFPLLCLHEIKVNAKNPSSIFHQYFIKGRVLLHRLEPCIFNSKSDNETKDSRERYIIRTVDGNISRFLC